MTRKPASGVEVLSPELVLRRYANASIEDEIELRRIMNLGAAMLVVTGPVSLTKKHLRLMSRPASLLEG